MTGPHGPEGGGTETGPAAWRRAAAAGLAFRAIDATDLPFLERVYAATRTEELAATGWSEVQKAVFLGMQFAAQHRQYQQFYPDADWLVILTGGEPAGRLYLERWTSQYRIIDIALLPEHRGKGHGGALLRDVIDEAAGAAKAVSIHVEKTNPAMRLYRRLGFILEEDKGVYDLLRRDPQPNTAS